MKVIDYQYFMDEMQPYEAQLLTDMIPWAVKQSMEQTRLLMYTICAPYMKKKKKIIDFFPLMTDNKEPIGALEGEELDETRKMIRLAFSKK